MTPMAPSWCACCSHAARTLLARCSHAARMLLARCSHAARTLLACCCLVASCTHLPLPLRMPHVHVLVPPARPHATRGSSPPSPCPPLLLTRTRPAAYPPQSRLDPLSRCPLPMHLLGVSPAGSSVRPADAPEGFLLSYPVEPPVYWGDLTPHALEVRPRSSTRSPDCARTRARSSTRLTDQRPLVSPECPRSSRSKRTSYGCTRRASTLAAGPSCYSHGGSRRLRRARGGCLLRRARQLRTLLSTGERTRRSSYPDCAAPLTSTAPLLLP